MTEQPPPDAAQPLTSTTAPAPDAAAGPLVDWQIPEARPVPGRRQIVYADVPNRAIAYILDLIAIIIIVVAIALIVGLALAASGGVGTRPSTLSGVGVNLLGVLLVTAYFLYGWTSRRATVGMRWLGLQIGNEADGSTLTLEQGVRRAVALFGPGFVYNLVAPFGNDGLTGLLGLIAFGWFVYLLIGTARSPTKQGFHDRFAKSLVVKVTRAPT